MTVNLWVDRPLLSSPFVGLPGRTMQWAFETTPGRGRAGARLALVVSGADDILRLPNPSIVQRAAAELRDALPHGNWRIEHASVLREPRATFSLAPGQPPRPGTETPVGGLLLAGDWIDTGLPGRSRAPSSVDTARPMPRSPAWPDGCGSGVRGAVRGWESAP